MLWSGYILVGLYNLYLFIQGCYGRVVQCTGWVMCLIGGTTSTSLDANHRGGFFMGEHLRLLFYVKSA